MKIKVKCDYCGKVFDRDKKRIKPYKNHFCNSQCSGLYRRGKSFSLEHRLKMKQAAQKRAVKNIVNCGYCGKQKIINNWKLLHEKVWFCNRECQGKYYSIHNCGESNPHWQNKKNSVSYKYGPAFNEKLKQQIRWLDNYKCQLCGKLGKDVHHIDYNKQNNTINNLTTLCRSCHAKTFAGTTTPFSLDAYMILYSKTKFVPIGPLGSIKWLLKQ